MGRLRPYVRITAIFLVLSWLIARNRLAWLWVGRDPARRYRSNGNGVRATARALARIVGMRVEFTGPLPSEPFTLVSNHLGYLDIVALCTELPCVFIAKSEVSSWPFIGLMVRSTNIEFVDRVNHRDLQRVNQIAGDCVRGGRSVIFFPEGTSSSGQTVLPFRPSLLEYAAAAGCPVHCAAISYATPPGAPPARDAAAWWGDMDFFTHLFRLCRNPSLTARIAVDPVPVSDPNRKVLAARLHAKCAALFTPTDPTPP